MSVPSLDKPFRFTAGFWVAFAVLAIPTLRLAQPWHWELPVISKIAGTVFIPFAAVVVCYCPVMFVMAVIQGGKEGKEIASAFIGAIAGAAVFLCAVWIVYGFDRLPSWLAIPAVLIASAIYSRGKTNSKTSHHCRPRPTSRRLRTHPSRPHPVRQVAES